jgi:arabinosyltransferase C
LSEGGQSTSELQEAARAGVSSFCLRFGIVAVTIALIPALIGHASAPPGSLYLGVQTNVDDHMVYASWMRQAMEGKLLFENRFAIEPQPGLTLNLYFLALGLVAKVVSIPVAWLIARAAFSLLFVVLLGGFLLRIGLNAFQAKLSVVLVTFGGGVGFFVWEKFGQIVVNSPAALKAVTGGRLPIDVWQPEAFVFPSMLTNGLFMASLCLILVTFQSVLQAKDGWSSVPRGALAFGVLMNIHSYDALLVGLVLTGLLAAQLAARDLSWAWMGRATVIAAGAVPAAAWFLFVLYQDPVFQSRASTETFSPVFRQVALGILPVAAFAALPCLSRGKRRELFAAALALLTGLTAFFLWDANPPGNGHTMTGPFVNESVWPFLGLLAPALAATVLFARPNPGRNLLWAWALVGVAAVYFPALFQRKLAMGLVVPWAILAAIGLSDALQRFESSTRNLVASLSVIVASASSLFWFQREALFIRNNVASTAVHPVYYSRDTGKILDILGSRSGRKVVLAMPGVWRPIGPADFSSPLVPDLNPVLVGLAGATAFAGHWSETPDYPAKRHLALKVFLSTTPPEQREEILRAVRPDFIVAPNPETFGGAPTAEGPLPIADLRSLGRVEYHGDQFLLISLKE